jgi:hypothetical protein
MDIVEVMEVRDGLIRHHRVYWGWYSVRLYEDLDRSGRGGRPTREPGRRSVRPTTSARKRRTPLTSKP